VEAIQENQPANSALNERNYAARMKVTREYSQQARCLHFDANGNKLSHAAQGTAPVYDPWQVLRKMQAHLQEPGLGHTEGRDPVVEQQ